MQFWYFYFTYFLWAYHMLRWFIVLSLLKTVQYLYISSGMALCLWTKNRIFFRSSLQKMSLKWLYEVKILHFKPKCYQCSNNRTTCERLHSWPASFSAARTSRETTWTHTPRPQNLHRGGGRVQSEHITNSPPGRRTHGGRAYKPSSCVIFKLSCLSDNVL